MKKTFILMASFALIWAACNTSENTNEGNEQVEEIRQLNESLDTTLQQLGDEVQDMESDVDSLLEGI
jgi:predicted nuclease with TOPRIM domain